MKRKFSLREQILMVVLALLLLICVYYILVERPVQDTLLSASQRQSEAESPDDRREVQLGKMRKMQSALDSLDGSKQADVPDYDNTKNVVEMLNNALSISDGYNLTFQSVVTEGAIVKRTVQMNFRCDGYATAKQIMQTLLSGGYRCRITSMSVAGGQGGDICNETVTCKASVTFYEFLSKEQR